MVKWDPGKIIRDPRGEITGVARDSSAQRACDVIRAWLDCILNRAKKWSVCLRSETSPLQNNEKKNTEAQVNHFSFIILDEWVMKSPWPLASSVLTSIPLQTSSVTRSAKNSQWQKYMHYWGPFSDLLSTLLLFTDICPPFIEYMSREVKSWGRAVKNYM